MANGQTTSTNIVYLEKRFSATDVALTRYWYPQGRHKPSLKYQQSKMSIREAVTALELQRHDARVPLRMCSVADIYMHNKLHVENTYVPQDLQDHMSLR